VANLKTISTGALICFALVSGWASAQPAAPPAAGAQPSTPPTATPAPTPVPFDEAFNKAANDMFSKANLPEGTSKVTMIIDPLIDASTGAQSRTTVSMEKRLTELARNNYPRFEIVKFSADTIDNAQTLLVGSVTAINNAGQASGPRDAYSIWLTLIDLKSQKVIGKGIARAQPNGIDPTPTPYFAEAPVYTKDAATDGYIKACRTPLGQSVDQAYLNRLRAQASLSDAINAYNERRYDRALELYQAALKEPGGDQLRAYNGLYLANWRLKREKEAAEAFNKIVDYSLNNNRLAVKFLFRPGTTQFYSAAGAATPYNMWVRQIANHVANRNACLQLVGHASPTGPEPLNDRLSKRRADAVMTQISTQQPALSKRLSATGVGFREVIVGTGRDDASDALDRRV